VEDIVTNVLKSRYPVDTVPQDAVHFSEREQGHHFHDKNPAVGTESIYISTENKIQKSAFWDEFCVKAYSRSSRSLGPYRQRDITLSRGDLQDTIDCLRNSIPQVM